MQTFTTQCTCGQSGAHLSAAPSVRFRCHCTICQGVYKSGFADVLVFRRGQARAVDPGSIRWMRTKRITPLVRGLCDRCQDPVLAHFYGALSFVPTRTAEGLALPPVAHDIYYDTRQGDVSDDVPKSDGMMAAYARLTLPFMRVLALPGRRLA